MSLALPDYIIVGAGSSGCVVVNRLSADPSIRVLLLEAGESGESDPGVTTPGQWVSLIGSKYDWRYETQPEPGLEGRRIPVPRGRILGGSSAINAMAHVRGHRRCFDEWEREGNRGWSYDCLLPLFKRSERNGGGESEFRGGDGPLAVSRCSDPHDGHRAFLEAARHLGYRADPDFDFNVPEPDGVAGYYQKNILDGRRHSAAAAFLLPILERPNVEIRSRTQAMRLVVEGGRVVGVECLHDGRLQIVRADREVILCAGAIDSPRLLMCSGIGPAERLHALGIPAIADLPGVGRNLQDHLKLSLRWTARRRLPPSTVTAGLFASSGDASLADLQFYVGRGLAQPDELVTITVSLVRPSARGSVDLRPGGMTAEPLIRANFLQSAADLNSLMQGVLLARAFGESAAFEGLRGEAVEPGPGTATRVELERFIRQKAETIYHAAGTCRMGPEPGHGAVVGDDLRVHGVEGVRVADASIMPVVVNAPTHASCIAIGEKCAALVSGREGRGSCPDRTTDRPPSR